MEEVKIVERLSRGFGFHLMTSITIEGIWASSNMVQIFGFHFFRIPKVFKGKKQSRKRCKRGNNPNAAYVALENNNEFGGNYGPSSQQQHAAVSMDTVSMNNGNCKTETTHAHRRVRMTSLENQSQQRVRKTSTSDGTESSYKRLLTSSIT